MNCGSFVSAKNFQSSPAQNPPVQKYPFWSFQFPLLSPSVKNPDPAYLSICAAEFFLSFGPNSPNVRPARPAINRIASLYARCVGVNVSGGAVSAEAASDRIFIAAGFAIRALIDPT